MEEDLKKNRKNKPKDIPVQSEYLYIEPPQIKPIKKDEAVVKYDLNVDHNVNDDNIISYIG